MGDQNLISLKEAADISGYAPDYIGQLIRAGKIPGKQVYTGITWMTTADAVMAYKNKKITAGNSSDKKEILSRLWQKMAIELNIIKLFFQTFKSAIPIFFIIIICLAIIASYGFNMIFNHRAAAGTNSAPNIDKNSGLQSGKPLSY